MSRPKPKVLAELTNKATYKTEQVLASEGVWAVFFDSKPINLKNSNMLISFKQKLTERLNLIRQDLVSGAIEEAQAKNLIQKEEAYIREYKKSLKTETEKFTQEWDTCKHYKNIVLQRFY